MSLSDSSQMKLMKKDAPTMKQVGPASRTKDHGDAHDAKPLSDKGQQSLMKRK